MELSVPVTLVGCTDTVDANIGFQSDPLPSLSASAAGLSVESLFEAFAAQEH